MPLLRNERRVRRRLPPNLRDGEAALFSGELERVIPPTTLQELEDVRITAEGLLFQGLRLLPESFPFPFLKDQLSVRARAKLIAVNFALRQRRRFEPDGVWITDTWSEGYFHWLLDALPRLCMVRDRLSDSVLLLPHAYHAIEYVRASLDAFEVRNVRFIGADEVLICRRLMFPEHAAPSGHYDEELIRCVRDTLRRRYGDAAHAAAGTRLYISRALTQKRRIVNEQAVIDALRARDFQVVHSERMPLAAQVRLFSTARILVANHGAGLTNMLFAPGAAKVLELRHDTDAVNNCYFTLAAAMNHQYFFQGCSSAGASEDPHVADLVVDIDRLEENLQLMLSE